MKYAGIDFGMKRIGVAVSDEGGTIAFPRTVIRNDDGAISFLKRLVQEERIGQFVAGDTRTVGGHANAVTEDADSFFDMLARETGTPVSRASEAWSSIEASRYAPDEKSHDDAAAAAVILQRFLDMRAAR